MKLSGTGDVIGTLTQDRATAIAGRLGPGPRMVPINLTLETDRGPKRTFRFEVVNDQMFTPLMTYASLLNTLGSYERQYGAATFSIAASYVVAPVTFLLGNDYEKVELESLDLTITSAEEPKTATLERVWIDDPRPRPGHTVPLKVLLRTYRGEEVLRTLPIDIPANASGTLSVLVSDGSRLSQIEQRETRTPQQQRSVAQIIRALNKARRNNTLYVKLLGTDAGAVVNGEKLSALPPSVLAVIEGDRNSGGVNSLTSATMGEWELPTESAVTGTRTLSITLSSSDRN
jgi:hypothetical protein